MPLRLEIKKKLSSRTERVKCVDIHPSEALILSALYSGTLMVWNYESSTLLKSLNVTNQPIRSAKFIARKNWIISGSDDMMLRIFSYNTLEKLKEFEAHVDYIRALEVHPTLPYVLSASDDMQIKLWDWSKDWTQTQSFDGHAHYIMCLAFNPKDQNSFATASLDRSLKIWSLNSPLPNYSLEGHTQGVNAVSYYPKPDKPYLVSAADDAEVRIWDYQTKTCIHTLTGHTGNVSTVLFHPRLPLIISGSEDGTVRLWHSSTYKMETTLNYGLERAWTLASGSSNVLAIGYDEGTVVLSLGEDTAQHLVSLDSSNGKAIMVKPNNEIMALNLRAGTQKELGRSDIHVQKVLRNSSNKFVALVGDGEFIIYTAQTLRNKAFGQCADFAWSATNTGDYAVLTSSTVLNLYKNFTKAKIKGKDSLALPFSVSRLESGPLLGLVSSNSESVLFIDWETGEAVEKIDIEGCQKIIWSPSGTMFTLVTKSQFYVLGIKYSDNGEIEIELLDEIEASVSSAVWVGDCFIYATGSSSRPAIHSYISGSSRLVKTLDKKSFILGYYAKENKLFYISDSSDPGSISHITILESEIQFQTAVVRDEWDLAQEILESSEDLIERRDELARFLDSMPDESEEKICKRRALGIAVDSELKFQYAIQLGELEISYQLLQEDTGASTAGKWRELGDLALKQNKIDLAKECSVKSADINTQLLLSTTTGDKSMLKEVVMHNAVSKKQWNIAFVAAWSLGDLKQCFEILCESGRFPEAAMFCRTYLPSELDNAVSKWKAKLKQMGKPEIAESLADSDSGLFNFSIKEEAETKQPEEPAVPILQQPIAEEAPVDSGKQDDLLGSLSDTGSVEENYSEEPNLLSQDVPTPTEPELVSSPVVDSDLIGMDEDFSEQNLQANSDDGIDLL